MSLMYVEPMIIRVKEGIGSLKASIGGYIFMMRMGYSMLKDLNGGKFQVSNLRENE